MLGSAYIILTCLAGFYTLCLTRAASVKAPKPFMNRNHEASTVEAAGYELSAQDEEEFLGHSSGFAIGLAWESNSASLASNPAHHYALGSIARHGRRIVRRKGLGLTTRPVVRHTANRSDADFPGSMPPAA